MGKRRKGRKRIKGEKGVVIADADFHVICHHEKKGKKEKGKKRRKKEKGEKKDKRIKRRGNSRRWSSCYLPPRILASSIIQGSRCWANE